MNEDSKFVRALFGFIAWILMVIPFLYAIFSHNGWLLIGVFCGAIGATIKMAVASPSNN
jgi:hypothetical protein